MDRQTILNQLLALGSNETEVVENLQKFGIKGVKQSCRECPIAEYLNLKNNIRSARVSGSICTLHIGGIVADRMLNYHTSDYPLLRAIIGFITNFDYGRHPQLIK
jgi:hypothetical protein